MKEKRIIEIDLAREVVYDIVPTTEKTTAEGLARLFRDDI